MYHRRNILLYCQREERLSITRFVLHNVSEGPRYRVHGAQSKAEVTKLLRRGAGKGLFDGAVVLHCDLTDAAVWVAAELRMRGIPTVFVTEDDGMKMAYASVKVDIACPHHTPVSHWLTHLRQLMPLRAKYGTKTAFGRPLGLARQYEVRA